MTSTITLGTARVLLVGDEGAPVASEHDVNGLLGDAMSEDAHVIAVPVSRLNAQFFELKTGFAGSWAQKSVNYGLKLAVIGDISAETTASRSLADWVREANAGKDIWFVPDIAALESKLL